jgi:hypothetical protein
MINRVSWILVVLSIILLFIKFKPSKNTDVEIIDGDTKHIGNLNIGNTINIKYKI